MYLASSIDRKGTFLVMSYHEWHAYFDGGEETIDSWLRANGAIWANPFDMQKTRYNPTRDIRGILFPSEALALQFRLTF